jgi:hyperosmotically inducible periplasmic protein
MERWMTRAIVATACVLLAGCEAATNAAAGAGAYLDKTAEKIGQTTDDASITIAVKGALLKADEKLAKGVHVSTGNGIVSITGSVPTAADKAKVEEIAKSQQGVVRVINAIDVGAP